MDRNAVCAALAPALLLFACDRAVMPDDSAPAAEPSASATTVPADAETSATLPTMIPPVADGVNDGIPDLTPPKLTPETERSEAGARNVLLSFARAIEVKEFDQAWAMLSEGDRQKWSRADFVRKFADLDKITVAIPGGTSDGAAGSVYYSAPITITATDKEGRPVRYEGEAVLKRVNDVDGAIEAQLRWHFDRLTLDWTH